MYAFRAYVPVKALIMEVSMLEYLTPCSWLQSTVIWRLSFVQNNDVSELTERILKLWRTPVLSSLFRNSVPSRPERSQKNESVVETVAWEVNVSAVRRYVWYSGVRLSMWRPKHLWKWHEFGVPFIKYSWLYPYVRSWKGVSRFIFVWATRALRINGSNWFAAMDTL